MRGKRETDGEYFVIRKVHVYILFCILTTLLFIVVKNSFTGVKKKGVKGENYVDGTTTALTTALATEKCETLIYCHDVLNTATNGRWVKSKNNPVLPWKQENMGEIRQMLNLPKNMSRTDGRCGIYFPIPNTRLAAHCDPEDDEVRCCAEASGWCGNTREHCEHEKSIDLRKLLPPKDVEWRPINEQCTLKKFNNIEACQILSDKARKIVFLGDSQARQFFTALVLLLTNNYKNGAIKQKHLHDNNIMRNCSGEYQLLNIDCRHYLVTSSKQVLNMCEGMKFKFEIEYFGDYQSFVTKRTSRKYESMYLLKDSFMVIGAGTHFNSDINSYMNYFIKYIVEHQRMSTYVWPKFIVETLHDVYSPASTKKRQEFNEQLRAYAHDRDIAVFENSHLTRALQSYDGRTYGLQFNLLKVQILLNYFHNLRECASD